MLEAADTPAIRFLLEHGSYRRAVSTFPSLTPVCLASIATGGHGDVHGIPHLVWWNRAEQRLVGDGPAFSPRRGARPPAGARRPRGGPQPAGPPRGGGGGGPGGP